MANRRQPPPPPPIDLGKNEIERLKAKREKVVKDKKIVKKSAKKEK